MNLDYKLYERIVGSFFIVIVILLLGTVVIIGRGKDWFKTYVGYYTDFTESYNLQVNAPIKLLKADIGKVKAIILTGENVRIELAILEEYADRIREDSIATVESPTFIGSEYVSIKPGSLKSPILPEGSKIQSEPKKTIGYILDQFEVEKTAKQLVQAVQNLSEVVEQLKDPNGPLFSSLTHIKQVTENLDKIIYDVQAGNGTIGGLMKSDALLDEIHQKVSQIGLILSHVEKAVEVTPEIMNKADSNLGTLHDIEKSLLKRIEAVDMDTLKRIIADIEESLQNIKRAVDNIESGSNNLPQITQTTRVGIQEIRDAVENIDKTFQSIQKNILVRPYLPEDITPENLDVDIRP